MHNRYKPRGVARLGASLLGFVIPIGGAWADVYGRLHVSVKDIDTEKPVATAKIVLHDSTGVHPDSTLTADKDGTVTTPPLENHAWAISVTADGYKAYSVTQSVLADTTTEVEADLEKPEKVIVVRGSVNATRATNTTDTTRRTAQDIQKFPSTAGNPQSLPAFLLTNPGFVQSSVNVVHPRGEHASTTFNVGGIEVPGALQGRAGQLFSPEILQSVDVQTGAYSPEYGSESAAILNGSLRSGPIVPFVNLSAQGGSYGTFDGGLTLGGQTGDPLEKVENGYAPKRFRYFIDLNHRTTQNAVESPQPDNQTAHNAGESATLFGNFDYVIDNKNALNFFANSSPANTQIANRAGLSSNYAPFGQGYGYGGFRNADGTVDATNEANPGGLGDSKMVLPSQQQLGQDIYQIDNNAFGFLTLRHTFDSKTVGLVSYGQTHSGIQVKSNNGLPADLGSLPVDSSVEFTPNLNRTYDQGQIQASVTRSQGAHTFKAGLVNDDQRGNESLQFTPGSQIALDAIAAVDVDGSGNFAGRLTPKGHFEVDTSGQQVKDVYGNPIYLADSGAVAPTLVVKKTGYYRAAYIQDTWKATKKLTANYGLRLDSYHQDYELSSGTGASVDKTAISPRINLSYAVVPTTVLRASYNRLFTQPPLAQGAVVGNVAIQPETIDQYDLSVERQFAPLQTVKVAGYYKNIRNQDDTGILIPFTQIGAYTTLNYQYASVHGIEFSYDLAAKDGIGWASFIAYAHSLAEPGGLDQSGGPAPTVNDHDQTDTFSAGLNYTWATKAQVGVEGYYGSGEASSDLGDGKRHPHKQVNLRLSSSPKMLGVASLELDVQNLFDERDVLNFDSGFSGTRFQQGRFVLLAAKSSF